MLQKRTLMLSWPQRKQRAHHAARCAAGVNHMCNVDHTMVLQAATSDQWPASHHDYRLPAP